MNNILIVNYSLSGTTRLVARELGAMLHADVRDIDDVPPRRGPWGYLRSAVEALAKGTPTIRFDGELARYDTVVLGTPVWFGTMASPMRSFLLSQRGRLARVAFFCTMNGRGGNLALREMMALCGVRDAPALALTRADVHRHRYDHRLAELATGVRRLAGAPAGAIAAEEHAHH